MQPVRTKKYMVKAAYEVDIYSCTACNIISILIFKHFSVEKTAYWVVTRFCHLALEVLLIILHTFTY